jgi:hypothetical protein
MSAKWSAKFGGAVLFRSTVAGVAGLGAAGVESDELRATVAEITCSWMTETNIADDDVISVDTVYL